MRAILFLWKGAVFLKNTASENNKYEILYAPEDILLSVGIGTWSIFLFDGKKPEMYADVQMKRLIAIEGKELTPEQTYTAWRDGVQGEDIEIVDNYTASMIKNGRAEVDYHWVCPDKSVMFVRCGGSARKEDGKGIVLRGYHMVVPDSVKEQYRYQKEIKRSLDVMTALNSDYTSVYYVDLNKNKSVRYINKIADKDITDNFDNSHKYHSEAMVYYINNYICEEDKQKIAVASDFATIKKNLCNVPKYSVRYRAKTRDNELVNYEMTFVACSEPFDNKAVIGIRCIDDLVKEEVEHRKQLESALAQAQQANRAKSEFLSRMSHDLRTPLNGIKGMIAIAQNSAKENEEVLSALDKAAKSEKLLEMLVEDVLDMSRLELGNVALERNYIDVSALYNVYTETIRQLADPLGINVVSHPAEIEHNRVYGSEKHIRRMMFKIIQNSVKFNKPGGTVETFVREQPIDSNRSEYIIEVRDTGVGMSREFTEHLFEPFVKEHNDAGTELGMGLGLPIAQKLSELMGGKIEVESELGKGSVFTVHIPLELCHESREPEHELPHDLLKGKNVLIAEDNELNLEIAQYILENEGAIITSARNGEEAVALFKESPENHFDLILMDLMMPYLDGISATELIRSADRPDAKTVPIIAMSANVLPVDVENCLAVGMNDHIPKPLDIRLITKALIPYFS